MSASLISFRHIASSEPESPPSEPKSLTVTNRQGREYIFRVIPKLKLVGEDSSTRCRWKAFVMVSEGGIVV